MNIISVEQVKDLNRKIEELNNQGTRAKAKLEVMESNLTQAMGDYKTAYGVNLQGKNAKATAALIQAEVQKVLAEVQAEYDLRKSIVDAIERGDIDEANRLLGIAPEEEEPVEYDDTDQYFGDDEGDSSSEDDNTAQFFADPEPKRMVEDSVSNGGEASAEKGAVPISVEDEDDSEEVVPNTFSFGAALGNLSIEDDDDTAEEPVTAPKPKASGKATSPKASTTGGTPAKDVVETMTGESAGAFDDFDIGDEDFGFANLLSGTKFTG